MKFMEQKTTVNIFLFVLLLSNKSFLVLFFFFFFKYELCLRLQYVICGWLTCSSLPTSPHLLTLSQSSLRGLGSIAGRGKKWGQCLARACTYPTIVWSDSRYVLASYSV